MVTQNRQKSNTKQNKMYRSRHSTYITSQTLPFPMITNLPVTYNVSSSDVRVMHGCFVIIHHYESIRFLFGRDVEHLAVPLLVIQFEMVTAVLMTSLYRLYYCFMTLFTYIIYISDLPKSCLMQVKHQLCWMMLLCQGMNT